MVVEEEGSAHTAALIGVTRSTRISRRLDDPAYVWSPHRETLFQANIVKHAHVSILDIYHFFYIFLANGVDTVVDRRIQHPTAE